MSSSPEEEPGYSPVSEPVPGMPRVNHILSWGASRLIEPSDAAPIAPARISPAFGNAPLAKLMSLEAEAIELRSFREIDALMQEAPGA